MTFTFLKDYCAFTRKKLAVSKGDIHVVEPPYFINEEDNLQIWSVAIDKTITDD
jgi:hypothetical protein